MKHANPICSLQWHKSDRLLLLHTLQRSVEQLQQGQNAEALSSLPLDFSSISQRLRKAAMPNLTEVADQVSEACGEAGVEAGYAAPAARQELAQQASALSAELDAALRVR